MSFPIFHGIQLANNAFIKNFVVEGLANDPTVTTAGRAWFNTTSKVWKYSVIDGQGGVAIKTVISKEEIEALNTARNNVLASTVAGEGSALVGFSGQVGVNGKFSVAAGTVESAISSVAVEVDSIKKNVEDASSSQANSLSSTTVDNDGASLIGFEGKTGTNGKFSVAAGTVSDSLIEVVSKVDAVDKDISDNYLNKTSTDAQIVNSSEIEFKGLVKFTGDIYQSGNVKVTIGEEVLFEDNVVVLNSNVAPTDAPVVDAGWAVNRGTEGIMNVVVWNETSDKLTAIKDASDKDNLVYDAVAFQSDLDALSTDVDSRLENLEGQVDGSIGDLTTLKTEEKTQLVKAINEIHDQEDLRTNDLASQAVGKGTNLVGYEGKTGTNGKFSVAAGTTKATLDLVIDAVDNDRQSTANRIAELTSTDSGKGSKNIGFSGQTGTNGKFSVAAGTVEDTLKSLVTEADASRKLVEDTVSTGLSNLVENINSTKFRFTSSGVATVHSVTHNLNSIELDVMVWVDHEGVWQNDLVGVSIIDSNTIQLDLTEDRKVKVMVQKFDDVTLS